MKLKKIKKIGALTALTLMLASISNPILASATETETETETKTETSFSESYANIYASGNTLAVPALTEAAAYNIALQYEITYNILNDSYNQGRGSSNYAKIYSGESNGAFEGTIGEAVLASNGVINTNGVKTVANLSASTNPENADVDGENGQTVIEGQAEVSAEELANKVDEYSQTVAKELTDAILEDVLIKYLAIDHYTLTQTNTFDKNNAIFLNSGDGTGIGSSNEKGVINNAVISEIGSDILLTDVKPGVQDAAKSAMKGFLISNIAESIKMNGSDFSPTMLNTAIQKATTEYINSYAGVSDVSLYDASFFGTSDGKLGSVKDYTKYWVNPSLKEVSKNTVAIIKFNSGYEAEDNIETASLAASMAFGVVYSKLPKDIKSEVKDLLGNAVNKVKKSESFKTLTDYITANKEVLADANTSLITWTPLVVSYDGGANDAFSAELKEYDNSVVATDGSKITKNGDERALETGDIFINLDESPISPILFGVDSKPQDFISTLHMGDYTGTEATDTYYDLEGFTLDNGFLGLKSLTDKGKEIAITPEQFESKIKGSELTYGEAIMNVITSDTSLVGSDFETVVESKARTVGIDSYGNLINGSDGMVLIPYWQNNLFQTTSPNLASKINAGGAYISHPLFSEMTFSNNNLLSTVDSTMDVLALEGTGTDDAGLKAVLGGSVPENVDNLLEAVAKKYAKNEDNGVDDSELVNVILKDGIPASGVSKNDAIQALALIITANTNEEVKHYNELVASNGAKSNKLYITSASGGFNDGDATAGEVEGRWTAASLIQKIGFVFDYGIGETLRLTFAQTVVNLYDSSVSKAGLASVFYTKTITENASWSDMIIPLATILSGVMGVYLMLLGFKLYRKEITFKDIVRQFIVLGLVLIIPTYIYGPVINLLLNEPTQWILGKQMKQTAVLDTFLARENKTRELNEYYENMFGEATADEKDVQLGDYTLYFYTNTDREGFDINTASLTDPTISKGGINRLKAYRNGSFDYPKKNLVKVAVPLTDLYRWVWDVASNGDPANTSTLTSGPHSAYIYDDAIKDSDTDTEGNVLPLFQWLAQGGNSNSFPVSGYGSEIGTYSEYYIDTARSFENKNNVAGETFDGGDLISGSELFYYMVYNASQGDVAKNLPKLVDISEMINYTTTNPTEGSYIVTQEDLNDLIRDLSLTDSDRVKYFGNSDLNFSQFTQNVIVGGKVNSELAALNEVQGQIAHNPQLIPPSEDFLGLKYIVDFLVPYRGVYSRYNTNLEQDVYDINSNLLNNYLSTYSMTKESLIGNDRLETLLSQAELMVMVTEAYFQVNNILGLENFPTDYEPSSITFDKYLTLIYMPLKDYGEPTLNFLDNDAVVPSSIAEYMAMSQSPLVLVLFLVAVGLLIIFGVLYILVFMFLMMLVMVYTYVKNYVIKNNWDNKAWLGELMIISGFAVVKLGLISIWYVLSYTMNKAVSLSDGGSITYPYALVSSLTIIAYMTLTAKTIFIPMGKAILADKENLGGQIFQDGLTGAFDKLRGKSSGSGGTGGSSVNKALGKEGSKGKLGKSFQNKVKSTLKDRAKKIGLINAGLIGSTIGGRKAGDTVDLLRDKLNSTRFGQNVGRTWGNVGGDPVVLTDKAFNNKASKFFATKLEKEVNSIPESTQGVAASVMRTAAVGSILGEIAKGTVTEMAVGDALSASILATSLVTKGLNAVAQGGNVIFDSTGYDLDDSSVRSELFKNSINDFKGESKINKVQAVVSSLDEKDKHLFTANEDGSYNINFGNDGLSQIGFNKLFNSEEYRKNFLPADLQNNLRKDGTLVGAVRITPVPDVTDEKAMSSIHNLFDIDEQIRADNNYGRRLIPKVSNAVTLSNMGTGDIQNKVAPLLAKGMYLQGDKILYDNFNIKHQSALSKLKEYIHSENTEKGKVFNANSDKLASYILNDGENQGFVVTTGDSDKNAKLTSMLYKDKAAVSSAIKYRIADDSQGINIKQNLNGLQNLVNLSKKDSGVLNNYRDVQSNLATKGDSILTNNGNDYHNAVSQASTFLSSKNYGDTKAFKQIQSDVAYIETQKKNNQISDDEYNNLNKSVYSKIQSFVAQSGDLNNLFLSAVQSKDTQLANQFINTRSDLAKTAKVPTDVIDKVNITSSELNNLGKSLAGIHSVSAKDGVLVVNTKKRDSKGRGFNTTNTAKAEVSKTLDKLDVFGKAKDNSESVKSELVAKYKKQKDK